MLDALAKKANEAEEKQDRLKRRAFDKLSESRKSNKNQEGNSDTASSEKKASPKGNSARDDKSNEKSNKKDDRWANRNRNGKGSRPMPHDYEVQEEFVFPDALTKAEDGTYLCPCGDPACRISSDVVDELVVMPRRYCLRRWHYPRFLCRSCETFFQASRKQRLLGATWVSNAFVADAIISKYMDGLPFYRQAKIHAREGLNINRSTLIRWANMVGQNLRPLWEVLVQHLRRSVALFIDETMVRVLAPGAGKAKQCYAFAICRDERRWGGNAPAAVAFLAPRSRTEKSARELLGAFSGFLHSDGYQIYDKFSMELVHANCLAHARRGIFEIWDRDKSEIAEAILNDIDRLFMVERDIYGWSPDRRRDHRAVHSAEIADSIFRKCEAALEVVPDRSSFATALKYIVKRRKSLTRFLEDGHVEIDNNLVENCMRPYAIVRKNVMFAGSEGGAENWAIIASLLATAAMNGVHPHKYLTWVLDRLDEKLPMARLEELLPWNYPGERSEQRSEAHRGDLDGADDAEGEQGEDKDQGDT
jgi:transposase